VIFFRLDDSSADQKQQKRTSSVRRRDREAALSRLKRQFDRLGATLTMNRAGVHPLDWFKISTLFGSLAIMASI